METNFQLSKVVDELSKDRVHIDIEAEEKVYAPMPDVSELGKAMNLMIKILFPGYFGESGLNIENLKNYIGVYVHELSDILREQIKRGIYFGSNGKGDYAEIKQMAKDKTYAFIEKLPEIKRMLNADITATFNGDPAAKDRGVIIYCYPGIKAITNHRIAHELLKLDIPLIPRIISEMAHSLTGIDIHPGARIGESFAIDHGTGVVIGETCRIGSNVKIYQGVTLGALSFPLDENGNPIKGIDRHPIIEDNVIIYSGATILGRITVGNGSVVGGNVWLTHDVPPNSKILQRKPKENAFIDGAGI
jgi:serine O-acetyltransferase